MVTARQAEMATIVDENIQGIRVVKAFNQESAQVQNLARATVASAGPAPPSPTPARHAPGMESLPRLGLALVLLYGGLQTIDGELAIGDLVAFSTYVVLLATPFRLLGFILIQWQRAGAAAIRVFDILDETPSIVEPNDAVALPDPAGRIEFDDVHFGYPVGEGEPVLAVHRHDRTGRVRRHRRRHRKRQVHDRPAHPALLRRRLGQCARRRPRCPHARTRRPRRSAATVTDDPFLFAASVHDNVAFARPDASDGEVQAALADAAASDFVSDLEHGPTPRSVNEV